MREYGEEKAKRELEELLQIIPIKIKNQDFINDVNENMKNQEYRMALEKVRRFLDEKEAEQVEIKPTEIEELDPDKIITETKKEAEESLYPEKLRNYALEKDFIGMLLNDPKLMAKYYILNDECYFDNKIFLEIYKGIVFTEGEAYTPYIAKSGYNFGKNNYEINHTKECLKYEYEYKCEKLNMEKIYVEIKKLFILRKNYTSMPIKSIQNGIVKITEYKLYDQMSEEEVKSAVNQVMVTDKFKQSVLSEELTDFFVQGNNNLTNGLEFPFRIISSVFKGIRRGETMAFAMPSNAGKSRFTINIAAYVAFIHKKKVLVISNEMSEEKMKLCLITTILNNEPYQKLHGQKLHKSEGELLEFKFRPDNLENVNVDENGYVIKEKNETQEEFVARLKNISEEFRMTLRAMDWVKEQTENSIYFVNITNHTNDELQKIIMNYYYKEEIHYMFYDTLKTDTENIGNGEEIKKTATMLSNLAQNFSLFIGSTIQLNENATTPINLTVNDLAVSKTVKEVLDTLCLVKQINNDHLVDYEYSNQEVGLPYKGLQKFDDPDVRYYACVVDKNRAGAKPKVLLRLNLAYNFWEELGYLRLKQ
ncbi:MAG: DnaB-like helicase C-terminal domain-containing protein [Clostridia bacterium]